ncbi:MAG TPA: GDP-mannose 4,6-dehydratase [Acidimicrobiales bacterium]
MRALVTGGRGFVGRWLCAHLEQSGHEVTATGEEVDVTDAGRVRDFVAKLAPDAVFHLAGQAHVGRSWDDPTGTFSVNAVGTVGVLDAARSLPSPPRVLVVSSSEVYGHIDPDDLPVRETTPVRPVSPYAASKAAAEVAAQQAVRAYGLPVVVVRPFNHIGPGQSPTFVVSALAKRIVEAERTGSKELAMGNASPRRDLTDVRDVVRAYVLLLERGEPGEVYNVCSGDDIAIGDLAERLVRISGVDLTVAPDTVELRASDLPVLRGDPSKLRAATGWDREYDLDRTLADVLAYWREQA